MVLLRRTRWVAGLLIIMSAAALLSGCALFRDQQAALVQQAVMTDLSGDFEGLRSLYTPAHREFLSTRSTMGSVYRADAGGKTPDVRHLKTTTVYSTRDRAVVVASFDFLDSHNNRYVVTATYTLTQYDKKWYILSFEAHKYLVP